MLEELYARQWQQLAKCEGHEKGLPDNRGWVRRDEAVEARARMVAEALRNGPMNKKEITAATGLIGYPLVEAVVYAQRHLGVVMIDKSRNTKYGLTQ